MIYYIYHSGFVLELEKSILIFDFYRIPTDKKNEEESFISKFIKRTDKKVYVFSSHSHSDHFNKEILKWLNLNENIKYILSDDIKIHKHKNFYFTKEGDSFELDNLKISTFGSTDLGSSFYVNVEDKNIFHSGDLHLWHWEDDTLEEEKTMYDAYMSELEKIKKLDRIDIAFVPVDPRLGVNTLEGVELFYKVLKPKLIVPMHFSDDYSQMKNFIEAFKNIKDVEVIEIDESMKKILE
ncbi:MAG: MBL fold metallo-hydrolase [Fusobacterium periodonticum]|nr:MBL fold metallo-hydrolase [Fusobacterium periodonticum]